MPGEGVRRKGARKQGAVAPRPGAGAELPPAPAEKGSAAAPRAPEPPSPPAEKGSAPAPKAPERPAAPPKPPAEARAIPVPVPKPHPRREPTGWQKPEVLGLGFGLCSLGLAIVLVYYSYIVEKGFEWSFAQFGADFRNFAILGLFLLVTGSVFLGMYFVTSRE